MFSHIFQTLFWEPRRIFRDMHGENVQQYLWMDFVKSHGSKGFTLWQTVSATGSVCSSASLDCAIFFFFFFRPLLTLLDRNISSLNEMLYRS